MTLPLSSLTPRLEYQAELTSFDGTETARTHIARPELYRDLHTILDRTFGRTLIARGAGLSYPAASFGRTSVSVDMTRFNRLLAFDPASGLVQVEPGLSIGALAEFLEKIGRYAPVLPGYPDITVGGCVAFNVHGKSQFHSGTFLDWIESVDIFHPDRGAVHCSRNGNADLFDLTVGGFGLTGIITAVQLRTKLLEGSAIRVEPIPVPDLIEAVSVMLAQASQVSCLYSWHNLNNQRGFGAGVIYAETFVKGLAPQSAKSRFCSPHRRWFLPLWNNLSTPTAMRLYRWKEAAAKPILRNLRAAAFPIEGLEYYYAAFGKRGFREYQIIVPFDSWTAFVQDLRRLLAEARVPITLASLKLFKGARRHLSFSGEGVCLAIDLPATQASLRLFASLDGLARKYGGIPNLSKDSRIDAALCKELFPAYTEFFNRLIDYDPERRFQSKLRERIGV